MRRSYSVGDFRCADCGEEYELKAARGSIGGVLQAGAWSAMQARLAAANNPILFVMATTARRIGSPT